MIKKTKRYWLAVFIVTVVVLFFSQSCKKDNILTDSSAKLSLSADTILFDTVFTTIGSSTKQFKIFNSHDKTINISKIRLAGGTSSKFRINIDGVATTEVSDIEIPANDSIFIFVKVTVDPNNSNSPLVISDSIIFETNGNIQQVQLVAWGQDAYYHTPNLPVGNPWYSIIPCNDIWTNDKPHVIYGYAVVDSACSLTIEQGAKIHFHNNGILWIYKDGTLNVKGTLGNPVIMQGDRLEPYYRNVPGQWGRIWFSKGSKNNKINYAVIKNGTVGIHVDTLGTPLTQPTLKLTNTIIENMSAAGIFAQGTWIEANNCVISNCGQYGIILNIGGKYDFRHCTIGNYWDYSTRQTPSLILNNYYKDINNVYQIRNLTQANFSNCIIHGSIGEEVLLDSFPNSGIFNFKFVNCLLKTEQNTSNPFYYENCLINYSPGFSDTQNGNFELLPGSVAINNGNVSIGASVLFDILRHNRTIDSAPDIGAYEKQ